MSCSISNRLLAYEALLRAGGGVLDAIWPVRGEHWRRFTAQMLLASIYPGLQGIGFAARIDSNRLALGFDPMTEPRRRVAMERARDSGAAALSGKIVFVQDLRRGLRTAGFVLFLPVLENALDAYASSSALLKQVITNLLGNALKLSRQRRRLRPAACG